MAILDGEYTFKRGWRARQEAGRAAMKHKLATSDVREQRRALIESIDAAAKAESEIDVDAAAAAATRAANETALALEAKAKAEAEQKASDDAAAAAAAAAAADDYAAAQALATAGKPKGKKAPKIDSEGAVEE